ncbi:MAG: MFS transporter [Acidobacteriota bacterium]
MTSFDLNPDKRHDPYAALRSRDFRLLLTGRFITMFGSEMLFFAISWELWLRTHKAFSLGLVGLVQVLPIFLFSLPAGHVADQYNRRRIVMITRGSYAVCALGLAWLSYTQGPLVFIYLCLLGIGVCRAFNDPASSTLLPETVPPELFASAATWSSSLWQLASIAGPAVAGLIVALGNRVTVIYLYDACGSIVFLVLLAMIRGRKLALSSKSATWDSLTEGLRFIRDTKVILAAITLDLFAVLFGGAVALLPIYATDILKVGAKGLGILRAAPSVGAVIVAFAVAHLPPFKRAGKTLLLAVAGFGIATIVFGMSKIFWLSIAMLLVLGGLDNISVIVRHTLMLTRTPDEMRGRASAVNGLFISASNELGSFESGLAASLFGPVISVVGGGIGTIVVAVVAAKIWPEMRNLKTLSAHESHPTK